MPEYKPLFTTTDDIVQLLSVISELIGHINSVHQLSSNPQLHWENRIKTI